MKIGVIVCAYDCVDTIEDCLNPWVEAAKEFDIELGIVSTLFSGYPPKDNEPTIKKIYDIVGFTKAFVISEVSMLPMPEHEARNIPLEYFLKYEYDYIWILDGDEIYTKKQIEKILWFIQHDSYIAWWSMPFKNYLFDGNVWVDGFEPPRIFRRVTKEGYVLKRFYWDNDVQYEFEGKLIDYRIVPNSYIPKTVAFVRHLTWLNSKGKDKVTYQLNHFGRCSYKWNEETQSLQFDKDYFRITNTLQPELHYE